MMHFRQGDVLVIAVDSIPEVVEQEKGPVILAEGEATGHAHRVKQRRAKMFKTSDGARYLQLPVPATIDHEEHDAVSLPAGSYRVIRQVEYTPEEIRNVAD